MHTHQRLPFPVLLLTVLSLLTACADGGDKDTGGEGDADTDSDSDSDTDTDTDTDTDEPVGPGDGLLSVALGPITGSQVDVVATVDGQTTVAGVCVSRTDAAEAHLMEVSGAGDLTLKFGGLLASTDYDCSIAGVEPATDAPIKVSVRTLDAPVDRPAADVERDPTLEMTGAYTVMNARAECAGGSQPNQLVIVDPDGNTRWVHGLQPGMNIGIEVAWDSYNRFLWSGGNDINGDPTLVDVLDGDVWELTYPGSDEILYHHDVNRIEDGRILTIEQTEDLGWEATQFRLVDELGNTSWFYDLATAVADGDLIPPTDDPDPHHLNWADVAQTPSGLTAFGSLCYAFEIIAIDVAKSEIAWQFGYGRDYALQDPQGNPLPDDYPQCQHGLSIDEDGDDLLVYDNGFNRGYTRAVEFHLDHATGIATKTWEWTDPESEYPWWEIYHGNTEWLTPDRSRILVGQGNNACGNDGESLRHSQIVEVDRDTGKTVHRLTLKGIGDWIYRAHRIEGCDVFANAKYCDTVADRIDELAPLLDL